MQTKPENDQEQMLVMFMYAGLILLALPSIGIFLWKYKTSEPIKFHGVQALFGYGVFWLIGAFIKFFVAIPILGILAILPFILYLIVFFCIWLFVTFRAFKGDDIRLPILSDIILKTLSTPN